MSETRFTDEFKRDTAAQVVDRGYGSLWRPNLWTSARAMTGWRHWSRTNCVKTLHPDGKSYAGGVSRNRLPINSMSRRFSVLSPFGAEYRFKRANDNIWQRWSQ